MTGVPNGNTDVLNEKASVCQAVCTASVGGLSWRPHLRCFAGSKYGQLLSTKSANSGSDGSTRWALLNRLTLWAKFSTSNGRAYRARSGMAHSLTQKGVS